MAPNKTWNFLGGRRLCTCILLFIFLGILCAGIAFLQIVNHLNTVRIMEIQRSVQVCKQAITKTFYNIDHTEILLENVDDQDKENIIQRNFLTGMEDIVVGRKLISKLADVKYVPAFNYTQLTDDISDIIPLDPYRPLKPDLKRITAFNVVSQN